MELENVIKKINEDADGRLIYYYLKNNDIQSFVQYTMDFCKCDENTAKLAYVDVKMLFDELYGEKEKTEIYLTPQQIAHNESVVRDWQNKPKCPTCKSTNVSKISTLSKATNTALFGIFGQKRKHQFKCKNCSYEW